MKTKKIVSGVLSGIMLSAALAGCAGTNTNTGLTKDGKVLLQLVTTQKEINEKSYNTAIERYANFEEFFASEYPDKTPVKVEPHYYSYSPKDYAAVAAANQLPTYYSVYLTEAKSILEAGYAKDITSWVEKYGYNNGIDPKVKKNIEADGKTFLLPNELYSVGIAVNIELLEKAGYVEADGTPHQPETFEELAQMASDIKKKTGSTGFIIPTMSNTGGWRFTPIAWAYGVDFMEQDSDGNWQATFNTPECVEALQWVKDLKWKYDAIQENVLMDESKLRNAFGAGEGAMTFAEGASAGTFVSAGMSKDNVGFIQLPAGPKRHVTLVGGSYIVFNNNATDEQVDAAFQYLNWVGSGRIIDDAVKAKMIEDIDTKVADGGLVGILNASPYTADDPKRAFQIQLNTVDKVNINMNHVKLYNDQSNIEWQEEEPMEAQALYAVLDNAIQSVLTDENADCKKLIEEACANFQTTLDTVNNG